MSVVAAILVAMAFLYSPQHDTGPVSARALPLYESRKHADWVESCRWSARTDAADVDGLGESDSFPAWTDVLVDFRLPVDEDTGLKEPPSPASASAGSVQSVRRWQAPVGWDAIGWHHGSVSSMRFTDPAGFRFTVVASADDPTDTVGFAVGRFMLLLPSMRLALQNPEHVSGQGEAGVLRDDGFPSLSATYSLSILRDAVADPAGWFGEPEWAHLRFGAGGYQSAGRALLTWAASGAQNVAEARPFVDVGVPPNDVAAWDDEQNLLPPGHAPVDAHELVHWFDVFGATRKQRGKVRTYLRFGVPLDVAARWHQCCTIADQSAADAVMALDEGGWTPADVHAWVRVYLAAQLVPLHWNHQMKMVEVAEWVTVPPKRAVEYLRAGFTAGEAKTMEANGEGLDADTLAVMAAMVQPPPPPF